MSKDNEALWIRRLNTNENCRTKLVCFPHAGAGASAYRAWPDNLPSDIAVMTVRYPGRDDRFGDPFVECLEALADEIALALRNLAQDRLVLFGHCMGASVAYEVALRLHEQNRAPAALCVSARRPPHSLSNRCKDYGSEEDIIAHAIGLDPSSALFFDNPELREVMLPAVLADYRLTAGYAGGQRPQVPFPIYGYAGRDDPELTPDEMNGWKDLTSSDFRLKTFKGGHFYLKSEETNLLADLTELLHIEQRDMVVA
jgi:pyochelin biosynthetic protein PchC